METNSQGNDRKKFLQETPNNIQRFSWENAVQAYKIVADNIRPKEKIKKKITYIKLMMKVIAQIAIVLFYVYAMWLIYEFQIFKSKK